MVYSEEFLKSIIEGKSIGEIYPYKDGTRKQRDEYIKSILADLQKSNLIKVEVDFCFYENRNSSYVNIFCYKKDGSSTMKIGDILLIDGITLYISKLTPLAIYEASKKIKAFECESNEVLDINAENEIVKENWDKVIYVLKNKLNMYGIKLLKKKEVSMGLEFKDKIPNILNYEESIKRLFLLRRMNLNR